MGNKGSRGEKEEQHQHNGAAERGDNADKTAEKPAEEERPEVYNVYTWGHGRYGVLLQDGEQDLAHPTAIRGWDAKFDLFTFRMYGNMSVLWDRDGILYSFGYGRKGKLGHPGDQEKQNYAKPKKIDALSEERISSVAGKGDHTIFLSFTGDVWGCGSNEFWEAIGEDTEESQKFVLLPTDSCVYSRSCSGVRNRCWI